MFIDFIQELKSNISECSYVLDFEWKSCVWRMIFVCSVKFTGISRCSVSGIFYYVQSAIDDTAKLSCIVDAVNKSSSSRKNPYWLEYSL